MTGFDETVPPEPDANRNAAEAEANEMDEQRPEHDSVTPALEEEPDPDEPAAGA